MRQAASGATGFQAGPACLGHLEQAAARLKPAFEHPREAYEYLAHGLHGGEGLSLDLARYRISRLERPRSEFLFGALGSGWQLGGDWEKAFLKAFNFATTSWYSWSRNPEPPEQRIQYGRMDGSIDWCLAHHLVPKGFGYVYLTPKQSYHRLLQLQQRWGVSRGFHR